MPVVCIKKVGQTRCYDIWKKVGSFIVQGDGEEKHQERCCGKTTPPGWDLEQPFALNMLRFISIQPNYKCINIHCTSILWDIRDTYKYTWIKCQWYTQLRGKQTCNILVVIVIQHDKSNQRNTEVTLQHLKIDRLTLFGMLRKELQEVMSKQQLKDEIKKIRYGKGVWRKM